MTGLRPQQRILRLPADIGQWEERARGADGVVLSGPSAGGPETLSGRLLEVLIDVERRGLHLVLVAHQPSDLDTPVAAIARHVLAADPGTLQQARARWGVSQVVALDTVTDASVVAAVHRLPTPAARTLQRRLLARSGHLRALVARIRKLRG